MKIKKKGKSGICFLRSLFFIFSLCFLPSIHGLCEKKDTSAPEIKVEITDADKEFTSKVRKATVIITDDEMKGSIKKEYVFKEGKDSFHISVKDASGNESTFKSDYYIQDYTAPLQRIDGIADNQIVNGELNINIFAYDEWFDNENSYVKIKGRISFDEYDYNFNESGMINIYDDGFLKDDYYTMFICLLDRAGNTSIGEISFTVNRKGSVFEVDGKNKEIIGVSSEKIKDFSIKERNLTKVDTESARILFALNARVIDLQSGTDYTVKELKDEKGYTYTYMLNDELFIKEGVYSISVKTTDEAGNVNDTRLKKESDEIRFAVNRRDEPPVNNKK